MTLYVEVVNGDSGLLPVRKHWTDAGADVRASSDCVLEPNSVTKVGTGIIAHSHDFWIKIEGRSSLAAEGIFPVGGVVDQEYRGEIIVALANITNEPYKVNKYDRIAQLVCIPGSYPEIVEVDNLSSTETVRGSRGFGSTGRS